MVLVRLCILDLTQRLHDMSECYKDDGNIDDCDDKGDEDEDEERDPIF